MRDIKQMDSGDSKEDRSKMRRKSARQALKPASYSDGLVRPSLKRTRKMREEEGASRGVNGSKESKNHQKGDGGGDDDEDLDDETPVKVQKIGETEKAIDTNERGDEFKHTDEVDVEMREEEEQDQDMSSDEKDELDHEPSLKVQSGTIENPSLPRREHLKSEGRMDKQISFRQTTVNAETTRPKTQTENFRPNTMSRDPSSLGAVLLINHQQPRMRYKNTPEYQNPMMEEPKNDLCPGNWSRYTSKPPMPTVHPTFKQLSANQTTHYKNTELKNLQKPVISKASPISSSRGWLWYMWKILLWSLILAGLLALGFFVYRMFLFSYLSQADVSHSKTMEKFDLDLPALKTLFPSQREEFWKRSKIHLKHHMDMVKHTEPVSVILTAGLQAERTLGCIARSLAKAYSVFHNASILEIYGTTKRGKDSDQVKLEIDEALREAFEGDKPAAVVHRFEELPPGSTLIFYRYCDHENAAYKNVFLVFTVMLSVNEINPNATLSNVEDMVFDHIKQKFVSSDISPKFNQMDVDKLSGLWSRISHVILPVAPEKEIEQQGCRD